jgi:hypothetical protein
METRCLKARFTELLETGVWLPMLPGTGLWMQRLPSTNPVRIAVINMFIMPVNCPVCLPDKKEFFHERN